MDPQNEREFTMISSNEWNKRDSRTLQEALEEFAVEFCFESSRVNTWDDAEEFWYWLDEDDEVKIVKKSENFIYFAQFEGEKTFYLVDDDKLKEMCMERTPEVELKKWMKKNGYCLD